tara:strand:+ start:399 stop:1688 length:1290 start_codon:yes stop_codon:yes gene_type:complete
MIKKIIGHRVEKKKNDIAKDGENVRISYVASTDAIDRYGDVVSQNWDLEGFKNNPVILWNHDQMAPPIGRATNVDIVDGQLMIDVEFDMDDPHAAMIARKAQAGFINAVSVGFQPIQMTPRSELPKDHKAYGPDGVFYQKSELLELSVVTVPANGQATQAIAAKSLTFTDLQSIFEKRSKLDLINRHIMQVKETEDSWFVEFAKAAAHSQPEPHENDADIGWGSGGDASQEMNFDWLTEYHDMDEDSEDDKEKEDKAVSSVELPIAPKEEQHNPEDQDMNDIIGAILGDDDFDMLANAFAFVEKGDPSDMDAYKLMIARMRNSELPEDAAPDDGELVVYWDLIERSMQQLIDGDVDIPEQDKEAVYGLLSSYYEKFEETPPPFGDADDDDTVDDRGAYDDDSDEDEESEDDKQKQFTIALIRALTQTGA